MRIPFVKAHGCGNDFLLTWIADSPRESLPEAAQALCDRHTGAGADGWYLVTPPQDGRDAVIRLFNSDGSAAELSGNGTRCSAAFLMDAGLAGETVGILTGAGVKELKLLNRQGNRFQFEMNMGVPHYSSEEVRFPLSLNGGPREVTIVDVGNPQCAVVVEEFPADWTRLGAEIERHPHFPRRTNVSFVRRLDEHTIEARFWERGAGETLSSGTGSTGAAVAAVLRGLVSSPVRVIGATGALDLRWEGAVHLSGPAEIVARGEFYWQG